MARRTKNKLKLGSGKGGIVIKIIVIGGVIFVAWDYLFNCSNIITPMKRIQVNPKCGPARFIPLSPRPATVEEARRIQEQKQNQSRQRTGTTAQEVLEGAKVQTVCGGFWDFLCHLRNAGSRLRGGVRGGII